MCESREATEALVRAFFATLGAGDLDGLRTMLHERATWTVHAGDLPGSGTHEGRDAIVDGFLAPVRGLFVPGDPKIEIDNLLVGGTRVAVEARGLGRLATGREYRNRYAFLLEVEGREVRAVREYMDSYYVSGLLDA